MAPSGLGCGLLQERLKQGDIQHLGIFGGGGREGPTEKMTFRVGVAEGKAFQARGEKVSRWNDLAPRRGCVPFVLGRGSA